MVTLAYPGELSTSYLVVNSHLYGPLGPLWDKAIEISLPMPQDQLVGTKGIFHENFVDHNNSYGWIYFNPDYETQTARPTALLPDRVDVLKWNGGYLTSNCGFALPERVTMMTDTLFHYQFYHTRGSAGEYVTYKVAAWRSNPFEVAGIYKYTYRPISRVVNQSYWLTEEKVISRSTLRIATTTNWSARTTPNEIKMAYDTNLVDGKLPLMSESSRRFNATFVSLVNKRRMTPADHAGLIFDLIVRKNPHRLNTGEAHFGDLAMEASAKVNTTNINMIAFLRDLKDLKSLVPKLKNFCSLKTQAGNYLSVKYGVMPTISDIQQIIKAMLKVRPYLDRNGFKTYTAGRTTQASDSDVFVTVVQRLKLAVNNEDMGLLSVLNKLESIGMFPSFKNIWDLFAYTFAIDWLVDVGGLLERVDTRFRVLRLGVRYVTMSRKQTTRFVLTPDAICPFSGDLTTVNYHRWVTGRCPLPPLTLQFPLKDFNHWLESTALIIQRAPGLK